MTDYTYKFKIDVKIKQIIIIKEIPLLYEINLHFSKFYCNIWIISIHINFNELLPPVTTLSTFILKIIE